MRKPKIETNSENSSDYGQSKGKEIYLTYKRKTFDNLREKFSQNFTVPVHGATHKNTCTIRENHTFECRKSRL